MTKLHCVRDEAGRWLVIVGGNVWSRHRFAHEARREMAFLRWPHKVARLDIDELLSASPAVFAQHTHRAR